MPSSHKSSKDASRTGEQEEKSSPASPLNKPSPGHAGKSISSTSSSSLCSSPSTSSMLSPGRAKMSVSGPCSSKSAFPSAPSSSSSLTTTASSSSSAPPKIHRARKTMNRPPPGQISHVETPVTSATPSGSSTCPSSDPETS
ncbi:uncharacterized protein LOC131447336 isoform X2 [Solea solea]|nr:uncharacterized protein LOC131447336 isoform X2 [Solea solea]